MRTLLAIAAGCCTLGAMAHPGHHTATGVMRCSAVLGAGNSGSRLDEAREFTLDFPAVSNGRGEYRAMGKWARDPSRTFREEWQLRISPGYKVSLKGNGEVTSIGRRWHYHLRNTRVDGSDTLVKLEGQLVVDNETRRDCTFELRVGGGSIAEISGTAK